ncbi:hypothetical protein A9Q78_09775 [Methylophaga sp. 41_12_T18]|nr:hypothetical protein A9Q78_09775 [Methylophaga sp. 41_12_T18]
MNQFNQQLQAAKHKQRLFYLGVFVTFLISAFIVMSVILASRGTRIEISPEDAVPISTVKVHQGIAIFMGETLYSISPTPAIFVSADGFKPVTQQLNSKDFGKILSVTLQPLPARLELTTNISDDKTSWHIDGEKLAIAASFNYELDAGDHEITVLHPYYQTTSLPVSLSRGELFKNEIELTPVDGSLTINTAPNTAHIFINAIDMGTSPQTLSLQGGSHEVSVSLDNYETINDTIEISLTKPDTNRNYRLELKKAAVQVSLQPKGGTLTLDGITANNTDKLAVKSSTKHQLTYAKPGYFSQSKTFKLAADESLKLTFNLEKEMGKVDIESSPAAQVKIDGKNVGTTPLQLSLQAINHTVTLSKQGYRSVSKHVTPSSSSNKKISVSLIPEKQAQLQESPQYYKHKAGGRLKLYKPNEQFTMGAKRSELGQRANEFIKKVKLNKAFYAGINEVTYAEYKQFDPSKQGDAKKPVTSVSWIEAALFCNWLSQQEGLPPVYQITNNRLQRINSNSNGYRLLTEGEWEWLARKSGKAQQTVFVWGNDRVIPKQAINIADESARGKVKNFVPKYTDGYSQTAPVGSFSQEKSGLYDQGGNVSEWTHDSYSIVPPKSGKVFQNPFDLSVNNSHVVKGANWRSGSITELRPSYREGLTAGRDDLGFRVSRYVYGEI